MDAACDITCDLRSNISNSSDNSREENIRYHLEYYFSDENLAKDRYLKSLMDKEGFVSIQSISTFNKMVSLNAKFTDIAEAAKKSCFLKLDDQSSRIKAYTLEHIIELEGLRDIKDENDLWEQVLLPSEVSREHCQLVLRSNDKWQIFTDDQMRALDCLTKLRPFQPRLRHKSAYTSRKNNPAKLEDRPAPPPVFHGPVNPMFYPVNGFVRGLVPSWQTAPPIMFPVANKLVYPLPPNLCYRHLAIPDRGAEDVFPPNSHRGNLYYCDERRDSSIEDFIVSKPKKKQRQRRTP